MPRHLYPGYRQSRTTASATENSGDDNENEEDEGNFRKCFKISFPLLRYSIVK
jgi:hypothetical protein